MFNNNNNKPLNILGKPLHALTHMDFTALGGNVFFSLCGMDKLRLAEANDLLNMLQESTVCR